MHLLPARSRQRSALSAETRHSALLLGGALGVMSLLAILLLFVTNLLGG